MAMRVTVSEHLTKAMMALGMSGLACPSVGSPGIPVSERKGKLTATDGGGVRGYFSLLVLEDLMREIQRQEQLDGNIQHSFAPCVRPPAFENEAVPFLPCHYFDYIGGTSTGAFRMTPTDCLREYETMAGQIFGNPRRYYSGTGISLLTKIRRRKYPTKYMRQAIRDVIARRQPLSPEPDEVLFQTEPGTCRGLVVSAHKEPTSCTPFLIRSYGNEAPNRAGDVIKGGTLPVCFAARAATAAPTFFRNLTLDIAEAPSGRVRYRLADHRSGRAPSGWDRKVFTDAGWVRANNPCYLVMRELRAGAGPRPRVVLVSVGTAECPAATGDGFADDLKALGQQATNAQETHGRMVDQADADAGRTLYFRFNLPHTDGLPVGTDEWQPRGRGHTTRRTIREAFERWRKREEAQRDKVACARQLVQLRRQRVSADRPRWNRYASG